MKKRLLYFFLLILFLFIGWQLFEYRQSEGNTIIQIGNQVYSKDIIKINFYMDGKIIFSDFLNSKTSSQYKTFPTKTSFGSHKFTINAPELGISKDIAFHSLIMKWVYIDLVEDTSKPSADMGKFKFLINTSSVPLAVE